MNLEQMSLTELRREHLRLRAFRSPSTADLRRENRVAWRIVELERPELRAQRSMSETRGCPNCAASGWHASRLTNWVAAPCEECGGTGRLPVLPKPVQMFVEAGRDIGLRMEVTPLIDPEKGARGRQLFAGERGR